MGKEPTSKSPEWYHKYAFWLILGGLSTYFAEVVTSSTPFPFFTPSGLIVTYPFYTLNILVFSYVAFQKKRVDLYTLFLAGQVFGLFEAYGTKMLWNPGWGAEPRFLGISVVPFLLLIFLWHPIMSFALPIMISETYLTTSRETISGLPEWLSNRLRDKTATTLLLILFILFCGINQAVNSPSKLVSLLSPSLSWVVVVSGMWLWRRKGPQTGFRALLPTKRELLFLLPLWGLMYILIALKLFPEGIPPIRDQFGVWIAYVLLGTLLYLDVSSDVAEVSPLPAKVPWKIFAPLGIFVAFIAYLLPKSVPLVVMAWVPGVGFGIVVFYSEVLRIIKKKR
ncbi:hypothetical protein [Thermococcus thermotolerans]|uniref:hypothetical protein n=1 Tax=Thermococcus thermotolerans TaxID=2969672 RepID=UPI0021584500|nr:hypothetical protein [Thermococcus thermotolerans]